MQWWIPIPWALALLGIGVAVYSLRRSRYAVLRVLHISAFGVQRPSEFKEIRFLTIRLSCAGADVFDPKVSLECGYARGKRRSSWPDVLALDFTPRAPLPNPLKSGQEIEFELADTHLRNALTLNAGYHCLPSLLPRRRVRIAVYRNGDRIVTSVTAGQFREQLITFEALCADAVRPQGVGGWSHYYDQNAHHDDA